MSARPHVVYRLYDRADLLLYVGITDNWERRRKHHAVVQPWFPLVDRVETETVESREAALLRERDLVRSLAPVHNRQLQLREPYHPVDDMDETELIDHVTGPQAAEVLGVDPSVVRRACIQKRLRGTKRGRDWYIRREEVERYAAERKNSGKPFKATEPRATPPPQGGEGQ